MWIAGVRDKKNSNDITTKTKTRMDRRRSGNEISTQRSIGLVKWEKSVVKPSNIREAYKI